MKSVFYIVQIVLMSCCLASLTFAQTDSLPQILPQDTNAIPVVSDANVLPYSSDTLDSSVDYDADSIVVNNATRFIYLYGDAMVTYGTYSISGADYIEIDLDSNLAVAQQWPDSLKKLLPQIEKPERPAREEEEIEQVEEETETDDFDDDPLFNSPDSAERQLFDQNRNQPRQPLEAVQAKDGQPTFKGEGQEFIAEHLKFNFDTKRGKIFSVRTQQQNLYVLGRESKFLGATEDTVQSDDQLNAQSTLLTTCNHEVPHYGIRSSKQKIIPGKQAIFGPSNLEIAGIPTPLFLPFGFFPISEGPQNGLIFPSDYEFSEQWGFGLRDIGYYLPLSEKIDLKILGDIYFNGSWGIKLQSRYKNRYRYGGNIDLGYSVRISEQFVSNTDEEVGGQIIDKPQISSLSIRWSHTQDRKAHPYRSFNASVNFQTQNYDQLNNNGFNDVIRNQYGSNIAFRYTFPNLPFSFSANVLQSSNSATGAMTFTLPDMNLKMRRIFPFERQQAIGKPKWYEQIGVTLDSRLRNRINTIDSLLFEQPFLEDAEFGVDHDIGVSASFQVLKYFSFTPSINFQSTWYWERTFRDFDPTQEFRDVAVLDVNGDTLDIIQEPTTFGMDTARVEPGFAALNQFDIGASLNTKVFFTFTKQIGRLKGLRSVVTPSISFRYSPDYEDLGYIRRVQTSLLEDNPEDFRTYSLFSGGIFGSGPTQPGEQMSLGYNFSSFLEAKVFSKRDSTDKLVRLINTVTFGGNYNFAADSLNFSQMRLSANAKLFKNISRVQVSALWDPYAANDLGRRIDRLYFKDTKKPLRFVMAGIRLSNNISVSQIKSIFEGKSLESSSSSNRSRGSQNGNNQQLAGQRSLADIFGSFRIRHDMVFAWDRNAATGKTESEITTHTISCLGSLPLTEKWAINVGNFGYDFIRESVTYPVFGFQRNLHCWSLDFNWAPLRNTFSLNLRVLQNPLDFLKIPFQRNNQDTFFN